MLDQNALHVLKKRYFIKDEKGNPIETPEGFFARVAGSIARAEENYREGQREKMGEAFYQMLLNLSLIHI